VAIKGIEAETQTASRRKGFTGVLPRSGLLEQGAERELIFRYDNAAHRPSLLMYPHKHTQTEVVECRVPTLTGVIDEILKRREMQVPRVNNFSLPAP